MTRRIINMMIDKELRYHVIIAWLASRHCCDILDAQFVNHYIEQTSATSKIQMFGADKCEQLGKDLGKMFKLGMLTRTATGLGPGDASMGFPKWIYVYRLPKEK